MSDITRRSVSDEVRVVIAKVIANLFATLNGVPIQRRRQRLPVSSRRLAGAEIVGIAREAACDLIVMGTHGRKGVSRALLGSAAEEIFRKASCPVLTVGPHVSQNTERRLAMKQILFATDFSPESLAALPFAVSIAQEHQSDLTLLNVTGKPEAGELVHARQYTESALRRLQTLVPADAEPWCEPKCRVEQGPEAEKIMEVAIALGADLIVLGVRAPQRGVGATTHLLRSIAYQVVANAQCPVLTVRA